MQNNEIVIYHGSVSIIEHPEFGKGKIKNDYGRGFYCTEDLNLAKEWAVEEDRDGYANKYMLNMQGLSVLNLSETATVLHWITVLLQNRVFALRHDITKTGKKYLIEHFSIPTDEYDVIRGYRADDSYFAYAESFLNNAIPVQRLSEALRLGNLGEQIVLKSQKAFEHIRFIGYEKADAKTFYPLRQERNLNARKEFLTNRRGEPTKEDLFLSDIMRGGVSEDDPRLQ